MPIFEHWMPPYCEQCGEEKEQERRRQEEQRRQQEIIQKHISNSMLTPRFLERTFDAYEVYAGKPQEHILTACRRYAEGFESCLKDGASLLLLGTPGTGKNHLAAAIASSVLKQGHTALYTSVAKLIRSIKATWRNDSDRTEEQVLKSLIDVDLLLLDEVGVQFGSQTEQNYLTEVLNERYERYRPVVAISNLPFSEVKQFLGYRIIDRFEEGRSMILQCQWGSYRQRGKTA